VKVRAALLGTLVAVLVTGCTQGKESKQAIPSKPISMRYLAISGTRAAPENLGPKWAGYDDLYRNVIRHGYVVTSTDTIAFFSPGCGDQLHFAPVRLIHVDEWRLSWILAPVGTDGDCDGRHLGLVQFSEPVFDMNRQLQVRSEFIAGTGTGNSQPGHVTTGFAAAAVPSVPQQVLRAGPLPDWSHTPAPRCLWDRNVTDLAPCEEARP
jgi:hypothetical protein